MYSYSNLIVERAQKLYESDVPVKKIAKTLNVSGRVVYQWVNKFKWTRKPTITLIGEELEKRILTLIKKAQKSQRDYEEIDHLLNYQLSLKKQALTDIEIEATLAKVRKKDI